MATITNSIGTALAATGISGSISGTAFNCTAVTGTILAGMTLSGGGVTSCTIVSGPGGTGAYVVDVSQTSTVSGATASRDYSSVNSWAAALPANLVTSGNSYIGEVYNDGLLTSASNPANNVGGHTTDATHTITLRAAAGHGFKNAAGVQTNALAFNQANGAALQCTNQFGSVISIGDDWVTVDGLQMQAAGANGICVNLTNTSRTNTIVKNCILESLQNGANMQRSRIQNCAVIITSSVSASYGIKHANSGTAVCEGNTVVRCSDQTAIGTGIQCDYGAVSSLKNNAVFGFTTVGTNWPAGGAGNATDAVSLPNGSGSTSVSFANSFQATTTGGRDFRLKSGSPLINAGVTAGLSTDIVETSRPQGAGYDVGCWEFVAAGGGSVYTLNAALGTFSESGIAANPVCGRKVVALQAGFSANGVAAFLKSTRKLTAARGVFSEAGFAATPGLLKILAAAHGLFTRTGQSAVLKTAARFPALPGSIAWTVTAANFSGGQPWTPIVPTASNWISTPSDTQVWTSVPAGSTTWTS